MANKCDNCRKGKIYGHMVSHAKNRLNRIFMPNLQKLKVLKSSTVVRVKFCTSCIKRLRRDGRIGGFAVLKLQTAAVVANLPLKSVMKTIEKETKVSALGLSSSGRKEVKAKETIDISAIVGKKN